MSDSVAYSDPEEILGAWIRSAPDAMSGHLIVNIDADVETTWLIAACGIRFDEGQAVFCESADLDGIGQTAYIRCVDCLAQQVNNLDPRD